MKVLGWLFLFLCFQFLLCFAVERSPESGNIDSEKSNGSPEGKQLYGSCSNANSTGLDQTRLAGGIRSKHAMRSATKLSAVQRGKPVYGGNDVLHRPPKPTKSDAFSVVAPHSSLVSVTILQVTVLFFLAFQFSII
ncbi:hypothetical protein Syun_025203 [Stephania yunnanensis]|uniref:Uncharacterized protein n=1 Tax=Stephania yunnanensis TaxID=152371 RepID=A0AAP0HR11_9MAGN